MLALQNISAGYSVAPVLREINLSIADGELCALLGLNGSGKTTLLKAVCGLLPVKSGRCLVDGLDCVSFHEYKRAKYISYMPQRHSPLESVAVFEVVLMGLNPQLRLLESPGKAQKDRAMRIMEKMGCADMAERDFASLSEGQKQMIILTRTLVQNAPVMLMDEPDSALDFLNKHHMLGRVRELVHGEGKAGLITLHDPNFALAYCDKIILLHRGEIVDQISIAGTDALEIGERLAVVYGRLTVLEHKGRLMIMRDQET